MKLLQCPHRASISSLTVYCMKGNFPANCETCNCKDKYYVDVIITTNTVPYHASEGTEEEPVEVAMAKRYREENPYYIYDLYGTAERKEE